MLSRDDSGPEGQSSTIRSVAGEANETGLTHVTRKACNSGSSGVQSWEDWGGKYVFRCSRTGKPLRSRTRESGKKVRELISSSQKSTDQVIVRLIGW